MRPTWDYTSLNTVCYSWTLSEMPLRDARALAKDPKKVTPKPSSLLTPPLLCFPTPPLGIIVLIHLLLPDMCSCLGKWKAVSASGDLKEIL